MPPQLPITKGDALHTVDFCFPFSSSVVCKFEHILEFMGRLVKTDLGALFTGF